MDFHTKESKKNNNGMIASSNFYDLKAITIDGQEISFEQFKGKKVLIVNVASSVATHISMKDYKNYMNSMVVNFYFRIPCK
ncbi:MAG: hypothetical protein Ct9H90mP15_03910 [Candidatus Neomarinimicrobiota bacterium]|nr:MAG: hypothetical protein Ct9H90mP15_03910 [Candidatus Neomarinimicrobiota bacterium]